MQQMTNSNKHYADLRKHTCHLPPLFLFQVMLILLLNYQIYVIGITYELFFYITSKLQRLSYNVHTNVNVLICLQLACLQYQLILHRYFNVPIVLCLLIIFGTNGNYEKFKKSMKQVWAMFIVLLL